MGMKKRISQFLSRHGSKTDMSDNKSIISTSSDFRRPSLFADEPFQSIFFADSTRGNKIFASEPNLSHKPFGGKSQNTLKLELNRELDLLKRDGNALPTQQNAGMSGARSTPNLSNRSKFDTPRYLFRNKRNESVDRSVSYEVIVQSSKQSEQSENQNGLMSQISETERKNMVHSTPNLSKASSSSVNHKRDAESNETFCVKDTRAESMFYSKNDLIGQSMPSLNEDRPLWVTQLFTAPEKSEETNLNRKFSSELALNDPARRHTTESRYTDQKSVSDNRGCTIGTHSKPSTVMSHDGKSKKQAVKKKASGFSKRFSKRHRETEKAMKDFKFLDDISMSKKIETLRDLEKSLAKHQRPQVTNEDYDKFCKQNRIDTNQSEKSSMRSSASRSDTKEKSQSEHFYLQNRDNQSISSHATVSEQTSRDTKSHEIVRKTRSEEDNKQRKSRKGEQKSSKRSKRKSNESSKSSLSSNVSVGHKNSFIEMVEQQLSRTDLYTNDVKGFDGFMLY